MKWEINGLSLDFDITDADTAEKYENAYRHFADTKSSMTKSEKISDYIRAFCDVVKEFFSDLFDAETADKIFLNIPVSIRAYTDIYAGFIGYIESQFAETRKRTETLYKYIPNAESSV